MYFSFIFVHIILFYIFYILFYNLFIIISFHSMFSFFDFIFSTERADTNIQIPGYLSLHTCTHLHNGIIPTCAHAYVHMYIRCAFAQAHTHSHSQTFILSTLFSCLFFALLSIAPSSIRIRIRIRRLCWRRFNYIVCATRALRLRLRLCHLFVACVYVDAAAAVECGSASASGCVCLMCVYNIFIYIYVYTHMYMYMCVWGCAANWVRVADAFV